MAELSPIDRVFGHIPVTAALFDGGPAVLSGVDVAVLASRTAPDGATTWLASTYSNGVAVVLFAGPDADPTSALPVPAAGGDVWIRIADSPEIQAVKVGYLTIT